MNKAELSKKVLTAKEVSKCLRISLSTVHHLTRIGKIKGVKMGKQWCYVREDIDRCLIPDLEITPSRFYPQRSERRMSRRMNCHLPAEVVLKAPSKNKWSGKGVILNISRGGVLFQPEEAVSSEPTLCPNDPLLLNFRLPTLTTRDGFNLAGQVIHFGEADKRRVGVVGVKFDNISPEVQKAISDYIN